jgi:hypothetical protein
MQPEAVVVRAPLPAVRELLRPEHLPALVPGLASGAGGESALRLWRPGGVITLGVRLQRTDDGDGALVRSPAGAPVGFRLSLAARPASGDPPARCLLEGRVESDGADPVATAALRHALLRLVPEVAAAAEHAAGQEVAREEVARYEVAQQEPAAATPRTSRATAVLAALVTGGLLAAVAARRHAGKGARRA